jgi:hypothetical protein
MKLLGRLKDRRRRKAHQRYLAERERQQELNSRDTEQAIHDETLHGNVAGQGAVNQW